MKITIEVSNRVIEDALVELLMLKQHVEKLGQLPLF